MSMLSSMETIVKDEPVLEDLPVEIPEPPRKPTAAQVAEIAPAVAAAILKEAARRTATFSDLMTKKLREIDVVVNSQDADGTDVELVLRYRALSSKDFDDLVTKYPPTSKQKIDGMIYNPETFGPALIAAVCIQPKMSVEEVTTLVTSGAWSSGEVNTLTGAAFALCQTGAGVPFTVSG